jgi:hypothetical protein
MLRLSIMARAQAEVQKLAEQIGALAPADRAKLLARLLQDEQQREDWSIVERVRARNRGKSARGLKARNVRAVREVRRDRAARAR